MGEVSRMFRCEPVASGTGCRKKTFVLETRRVLGEPLLTFTAPLLTQTYFFEYMYDEIHCTVFDVASSFPFSEPLSNGRLLLHYARLQHCVLSVPIKLLQPLRRQFPSVLKQWLRGCESIVVI